jgi:hypothetical protein
MIRCPRCKSKRVSVRQRYCNHSAFNGYHRTPSRYSGVRCDDCLWPWRTLASVTSLPDSGLDTASENLVGSVSGGVE